MANPILDAISDAGYILDTPGAYLRGALSGRLGDRASGQDMLQSWGLDAGPVGGFAAEMVADPLALAGLAGGAWKGIQGIRGLTEGAAALSHADDANPLLKAAAGFVGDETGAMRPFERLGRRTDPDVVNSTPWYHGSATPGLTPQSLDPMVTDPANLFGRGIYKTSDPEIGLGYGTARAELDTPSNYRGLANTLHDQWIGEHGAHNVGYPEMEDVRQAFPNSFAQPIVYQGQTNVGRIADLDQPVTQDLFDALYSLAGGSNAYGAGGLNAMRKEGLPASELLQFVNPHELPSFDPSAPDSMIQALRSAGYDALTHTGGVRAGRGKTLHDVLISLDPNDTISQVGRANQITKFAPINIEELLQQLRRQ